MEVNYIRIKDHIFLIHNIMTVSTNFMNDINSFQILICYKDSPGICIEFDKKEDAQAALEIIANVLKVK